MHFFSFCCVCFSFSILSQQSGWKERLWNDLFCGWLTQSINHSLLKVPSHPCLISNARHLKPLVVRLLPVAWQLGTLETLGYVSSLSFQLTSNILWSIHCTCLLIIVVSTVTSRGPDLYWGNFRLMQQKTCRNSSYLLLLWVTLPGFYVPWISGVLLCISDRVALQVSETRTTLSSVAVSFSSSLLYWVVTLFAELCALFATKPSDELSQSSATVVYECYDFLHCQTSAMFLSCKPWLSYLLSVNALILATCPLGNVLLVPTLGYVDMNRGDLMENVPWVVWCFICSLEYLHL